MYRRLLLACLAGIIMAAFAIYPQWNLQSIREGQYNGAFASCDLDEMAYASYLQALIDGRPRKNDPYTGRDASDTDQQTESLFSIQFLPGYLAAVPARILGISASQMMPILSIFSAFFTALALFWLIFCITGSDLGSFAATLCILVGGAAITGIGAMNGFFEGGVAYPFFPFLRRPIPSIAFPMFFAFFACLWNGINAGRKRERWAYVALSGLCFASLTFSYFYLWTSAAAVLAGMFLIFLIIPSERRKSDLYFLAECGGACLVALLPYAVLLGNRNKMADKAQLLVLTRQPDLSRTVEIFGIVLILVIAVVLVTRTLEPSIRRRLLFFGSMALSPVLVFNQQVITGRSLQPFHYEFYVINYVVLCAVVLLIAVLWERFASPIKAAGTSLILLVGILSIGWGYIEASQTTKFWDDINIRRDEAMPVNMRLRELAGGDIDRARSQTTVNLESLQADSQPTAAPQAVLWARHQHTFSGISSWEENRSRYYQLLYFSDLDGSWLRAALTGCNDIEACMALFGWDRFNARLSADARPLTSTEIEAEVANFDAFARSFDPAAPGVPRLDYLVTYSEMSDKLVNIDRWYVRDGGEIHGKYTLYKLTSR